MTPLYPGDEGNVNQYIPKPGIDEDRNPTIHYGDAFDCYLRWLLNLSISYPKEEILLMTDNISTAFHQVLYHPDMGIIFSTVWGPYFVVPVSSIFGACNSPGDFNVESNV